MTEEEDLKSFIEDYDKIVAKHKKREKARKEKEEDK